MGALRFGGNIYFAPLSLTFRSPTERPLCPWGSPSFRVDRIFRGPVSCSPRTLSRIFDGARIPEDSGSFHFPPQQLLINSTEGGPSFFLFARPHRYLRLRAFCQSRMPVPWNSPWEGLLRQTGRFQTVDLRPPFFNANETHFWLLRTHLLRFFSVLRALFRAEIAFPGALCVNDFSWVFG